MPVPLRSRKKKKQKSFWRHPSLFVIPAATLFIAWLGGRLTTGGMDWYATLHLPPFTPPSFVFGLAWTLIFFCAALSAVLFWRSPRSQDFSIIEFTWILNAFTNVFWIYLFFGQHLIADAVWAAAALFLTVVGLMILVHPKSRWSSWLLLPYAVWTAFATFLTYAVWMLNR